MWTVYKHTAPSGKVYIGITSQKVKNRWGNGHGYKDQIFYRAIKKYGWENINHEILFEGLTKKQAGEMEQHLIEKYDCIVPKGYNKSKGGEYGFSGMHHSIEARQKISEANKGRPSARKGTHLSSETRQKMSESKKGVNHQFYGKHLSAEHRQKISEANKGRKQTPKQRDALMNYLIGHEVSAEARRKIGEASKGRTPWNKGVHPSAETLKKLSEANKGVNHPNYGKHLSAETRRKIGEATAKAVICVETGTLYSSVTEASKSIGVTKMAISSVLRGKSKTSGGYHWKYAEK